MSVYKNGVKIGSLYQNGLPVSKAYLNGDMVYGKESIPDEYKYIEIEVDSSSGTFIVPLSCRQGYGMTDTIKIYVNSDFVTEHTFTSNFVAGTGYTLTGLDGSTSIIRIEPAGERTVGWGKFFGFYPNNAGCNTTGNKAKLVSILNDPDWIHLEGETYTGDFFRESQYSGCTGLTAAAAESIPDRVTTIGDYFRSSQYSYCTGLTAAAAESIPDRVTAIGNGFRNRQYSFCTGLFIGNYIHHYRFQNLMNIDSNYNYMFYLSAANEAIDTVPRYYTDNTNTITAPITDLTPSSRMYYLTNRTGIDGYDTIDENWK